MASTVHEVDSARYAAIRLKNRVLDRRSGNDRGVEMMSTILTDLRFSFRMLIKTPTLSLVAIFTIALGVALTTHTFSSVYGTIVRGLPVPGEERLMAIDQNRSDLGIIGMTMSVHEYEDLLEQQTLFEDLGAFYQGTINLAGDDAPPERFAGAFMSANALSHLGVEALLGRTFREGEDASDASPVAVLGYYVWQNRFAGDPAILGKFIRVNGETTEIVGVMPEGFAFPFAEEIWVPHHIDVASLQWGEGQSLGVFGRLIEGATIDAARVEFATISQRQAGAYPETNENVELAIQPYEERFMPTEIRAVLWVMLAATFGVLLIACVNVANLLLARATLRSKEVAVRTALGASRTRVVRQMLVESLVLASAGGLLGVLLAIWGLNVYNNVIASIEKPYWIDPRIDIPMLLFALAVTAVAAVAAGILPAIRATGVKIGDALSDEARGSSSLRLGRFSSLLVVTEIAVSASLLVASGFMVRSIVNLQNVDLGFDTEQVLVGRVGLFETEYPTPESRGQFFDRLKQRLAEEPGVLSAALGTNLPGLGTGQYFMAIEGAVYPTDADYPFANTMAVTQDYFATFGVELLRGRDFGPLDLTEEGEKVAIVSQSFVDRHFAGGQALGRRVRLGSSDSERPWRTVVGVVPDMHVGGGTGGIGDDLQIPERLFVPRGALGASVMAFAVRTQGPPEAMASSVRALVAELDPNLPVYNLYGLDRSISEATWAFGLFGGLFAIFGAAALVLAAVGLYGVMAFSVAQRRQEMGIRMALGADRGTILRLVLGKGGKQLVVGIAVGLLLGAGMAGPMQFILYGVEVGDPIVYGSIAVTLGLAGLVACLLPARAATRTDPMVTMRT
jgi:predicted permease